MFRRDLMRDVAHESINSGMDVSLKKLVFCFKTKSLTATIELGRKSVLSNNRLILLSPKVSTFFNRSKSVRIRLGPLHKMTTLEFFLVLWIRLSLFLDLQDSGFISQSRR